MTLAYTNVPDWKARLSALPATGSDPALAGILAGVEASILSWLGYPPYRTAATYTEFYSGTGTHWLTLRQRPVPDAASVTDVRVDLAGYWGQGPNTFDSTTVLTQGTDYAVEVEGFAAERVGTLYRIGTPWPAAWTRPLNRLAAEPAPYPGPVRVVYTTGNVAPPADVVEAGYLEASARWMARRGVGPVVSESREGRSLTMAYTPPEAAASAFVSAAAKGILSQHRRIPIG